MITFEQRPYEIARQLNRVYLKDEILPAWLEQQSIAEIQKLIKEGNGYASHLNMCLSRARNVEFPKGTV